MDEGARWLRRLPASPWLFDGGLALVAAGVSTLLFIELSPGRRGRRRAGRRLGRLLDRPPLGPPASHLRSRPPVGLARLHRVEALRLRGGGWPLVVGRCTAGARVVLPGLAGHD